MLILLEGRIGNLRFEIINDMTIITTETTPAFSHPSKGGEYRPGYSIKKKNLKL